MKKSVFFLSLCIVCFCVFYGIRYVENPASTQLAISEVYENKVDTTGYIVRSEQVYNAPASGTIYHYIGEGTRVKKNRVLSTVYTGDVSEDTLKELENINKKLTSIENSGSGAYTVSASSGEEDIEGIRSNIIKARLENKISKIANYKVQINSIITGTAQETKVDDAQALKEKKQSLEAGIQNSKNDIYSQMSGIFSKNVDGLEGVLTPQSIMSYKFADYNDLAQMVIEYKNQASSGQPVCKVVNNHSWYVIMPLDSSIASELKLGQRVKLRFGYLPGIEADADVEYISTEEAGAAKNIVVVKCEQYKEGVYSLRFSEIELILESYTGFRVPVSAIRIIDGVKGVIVKNISTQVFKPCNVIYTDTAGQTAIITAVNGSSNMLSEYDNIVVGEK